MARSVGRSDGGLVVRSYEGKSVKVTVHLRPDDARKLRVAAVGLDLDLGDLVTVALEPVLRQLEVTVRVRGGQMPTSNGADGEGPGVAPDDMGRPTVFRAG